MGCCYSGVDNQVSSNAEFIDIPLLNKPRPSQQSDHTSPYYFSMDSYTQGPAQPKRRPSYEGDIIEHATVAAPAPPEVEQQKQQRFQEVFSHIEANTFQNIPIMSVQSHLLIPQIDPQQVTARDPDDYSRFIDKVIVTLVTPLKEMSIRDRSPLTIAIPSQ